MHRTVRSIAFLALLWGPAAPGQLIPGNLVPAQPAPLVYYVAENGDDNNPGTSIAAPLRTLHEAAERIAGYRLSKGGTLDRAIEVRIREGRYRLTQPLVLTPDHSGTAQHSVTFTAHRDASGVYEDVLIHGGEYLSGPWHQGGANPPGVYWWGKYHLNSVFEGQLGLPAPNDDPAWDPLRKWEFRDLYLDNVRLIRARHPNVEEGYAEIVAGGCTGNCPGGCFACGRYFTVDRSVPGSEHMRKRTEIVARHNWVAPRQIIGNLGWQTPQSATAFMEPFWPLGLHLCHWMVRGRNDEAACAAHPSSICDRYDAIHPNYGNPCRNADKPPCSVGYPGSFTTGDGAFFENAHAFADSTFEWFYDSTLNNGHLNVLLPQHVELNSQAHEVVAPTLERLVVVKGEFNHSPAVYQPVVNVHFRRLNFAYTHFAIQIGYEDPVYGPVTIVPVNHCDMTRGYTTGQAGQRRHPAGLVYPELNFMPAAVELFAADDCSVSECRVAHTGASGINVFGNRNVVIGNEVFDTGATGITVGPFGPAYVASGPFIFVEENSITDNRVHAYGRVYHDCVGILAVRSRGTQVLHNEVACGKYTGISVGWSWGSRSTNESGTRIHYNHVHNVMTALADGGGIYVPGNQTVISNDPVNDPCFLELWDREANGEDTRFPTMVGNWVHSIHKAGDFYGGRASGLYLESGARGWHVSGNVVEDVDYVLHINVAGAGSENATFWNFHTWRDQDRGVSPWFGGRVFQRNYYRAADLNGSAGAAAGKACNPDVYPPNPAWPASGSLPAETWQLFDAASPPQNVQAITANAGPRPEHQGFLYTDYVPLVHQSKDVSVTCDWGRPTFPAAAPAE